MEGERRPWLVEEQWGEWFMIAWHGAHGRVVAEAKRGRPFCADTGLYDMLVDPDAEVHFEFGSTAAEALARLKATLVH